MEGKIFRGEEVKEQGGQTTTKIMYMDPELTKNHDRNSVTGSNSERGAKIFKE